MKVRCVHKGCGWRGAYDSSYSTADPSNPGRDVDTCPSCRSVDSLKVACDEPGCWQPVAVVGERAGCVAHVPRDAFASDLYDAEGFGESAYVRPRLVRGA